MSTSEAKQSILAEGADKPTPAADFLFRPHEIYSTKDRRGLWPIGRTAFYELEKNDPDFPDRIHLSSDLYAFWLSELNTYAERKRIKRSAQPPARPRKPGDTRTSAAIDESVELSEEDFAA